MDLEQAAAEALEEGRGLATEAEAALRAVTEIGEQLTAAREGVAADWDKLAAEASALLGQAGPGRERLAGAVQEALDRLGALRDGIEALRGESEGAASEAAAGIQGVGEQAAAVTPAATGLGEALQGACETLGEQASTLADSLGAALDGARDFLAEEVPADAEALAGELAEVRQAALTFFEETAAGLEEAFATWEAGLAEAEAVIEQLFARLGEGMACSVEEAADRAAARYDEAWPALEERAGRVEGAMVGLAAALEAARAEGVHAVGGLSDELRTTGAALEAAHVRLAEVRGLLASYTFVQG